MTINGVINRSELGITSPHEHALIDIRNQYTGCTDPSSHGWRDKVTSENLDELLVNPYSMRDNLILDDKVMSISEISLAVGAGLRTFVDVTPSGIGRDPLFLRRLSQRTDLNVVMGCGFYTVDTHPPHVRAFSEEVLAAEMICDLTKGIDGTEICAGVIGELGTSEIIHEDEKKVLRAAALAHHATGAPLMIHLCPWGKNGLDVLDIMESVGVEPSRVCMCHTDVPLDLPYMREILRRGTFLEFDNFGKQFHINVPYGKFPSDEERLSSFYQLVDIGYADQILLSCDICLKVLYRRFGGKGYSHILGDIADRIRSQRQDADKLLHKILINNPMQYLDNLKLDNLRNFYAERYYLPSKKG